MKKGIPSRNRELNDFSVDFMNSVVANQVAWNIPAGFVTALQAQAALFFAAWLIVMNNNCTPSQRQAFRTAKKDFLKLLRPFIQMFIVYNPAISDAQRLQLGIPPRPTTRGK